MESPPPGLGWDLVHSAHSQRMLRLGGVLFVNRVDGLEHSQHVCRTLRHGIHGSNVASVPHHIAAINLQRARNQIGVSKWIVNNYIIFINILIKIEIS